MPIPTDTYWNIKRLNIVFALSAVALLAVTGWAILQDHEKDWRVPQRQARVWEAALVDEKIARELTPEEKQALQQLQEQIAVKEKELGTHNQSFQQLSAQRRKLESDKSTLEFSRNNLKSNVQVMEANLQDAIAAKHEIHIKRLTDELDEPQKTLAAQTEALAKLNMELAEVRQKLAAETAQLDTLRKQRSQMATDIDALQKKLDALAAKSLPAKLSRVIRDAPLLGFINPAERVQQVVLNDVRTDVAFMQIATIDRCMTCHVNIANKDYTEDKVLAYLQEQVATTRALNLPAKSTGRANEPEATADSPGPVAAVEFWHHWALKLSPDVVKKNGTRIAAITRTVGDGKAASVTYDGKPLAEFKYDPANPDAQQNEILLAVLDAYYRWSAGTETTATRGKATVTIAANVEARAANPPRTQALRYPEELRKGLAASLDSATFDQLEDRYRCALTDELNAARKSEGLPALDASPVLLAHPQLDLYVDIDSPHSFEAIGCTSCHDGSGQETDFVLAAHTPRDVFVDRKTGQPLLTAQIQAPPAEHHEREDLSNMRQVAMHTPGLRFEFPAAEAQAADDHGAPAMQYTDPVSGKAGQAISQFEWWKQKYEPRAPRSFALVYHEWDRPMRSPQYLQANCARCHTEAYDIKENAPVLYEGRQLFTHMGCVNCHQMDSIPAEQTRKVGTDLRQVTAKLSPDFINTWVWSPKAFRPTTKMPHFFMLENNSSNEELRRTRQESRAMTEYLVRTATPLPPKHVVPQGAHGSPEAGKIVFNTVGCLACHQNLNERGQEWITADLMKRDGRTAEQAQDEYSRMTYNQRQLYVQEHLAEPADHEPPGKYPDGTPKPRFVQVGPELSAIGTKLLAGRTQEQSRQWLFDWLKEPRHYSDYTIMPQLRLDDQQAMDLSAYLLEQKRTTTDSDDKWAAGLTPVDAEKLAQLTALQLRSRYSAAMAAAKADDDAELTALAEAALTTPAKPAAEAKAEVAAMSKDEKRLVFLGKKMIAHYGCMSCHAINGLETATNPGTNLSAWGQQGVDKLDFGYLDHHKVQALPPTSSVPLVNALAAESANLSHEPIEGKNVGSAVEVAWPHVDHNRNSWITQKLKNTRIYDRGRALLEEKPYDKLKMPTFYLTDEQVHAIVTFVISNRNRLVSDTLTQQATNEQARRIARGRELAERFNCVSCHQVETNDPQIRQYFKVEDVITRAPPPLRGEGNKIQHGWLFNFFKHVEPLRPLLGEIAGGIRMPSFHATDDEWTAIISYFSAASNKESRQLARRVDPVVKFINAQSDETAAADWWQRREFLPVAHTLKTWGLTHGHIKPIEVGPSASADDLRKVYRTLLFKAHFTRQLYNSPYPFVDQPRPVISDERFKRGEQFFYEMQCLKCHVLGDETIAGANKNPTAPNLSLTQRRLQRRWVRHWVQEPNIIQVGTAMPPFFTGLGVFNLEGQPWPASQGVAEEEARRVESVYGSTPEEQTDLLLDFLYAAGLTGYTGVQPATVAPGSAPTAPATQPASDAAILNGDFHTAN